LGHLLSPVLESISPLKNSCALFFYAHNSRAGFYSTDFFRIIVGDKGLAKGVVECRVRRTDVMPEISPELVNRGLIEGMLV